jgi:exosortase/archaeosortase family protein
MIQDSPGIEQLGLPPTSSESPGSEVEASVESYSVSRFVASAAALSLLFFGLFRVPWIQNQILIPYAQAQQVVAGWLTGLKELPVVVDFSCTGADVISLCLGAILAFPKPWKSRLKGAGWGLILITAINTIRIGSLSVTVDRPELFDSLHHIVWPAILILVVSTYIFWWMHRTAPSAVPARDRSPGVTALRRTFNWRDLATSLPARFVFWAVPLVGVFVVASKWYWGDRCFLVAGRWAAFVGGSMMSLFGATAETSGNVLRTAHGSFQVTPACMASPLIPAYYAAILALPMTALRRTVFAILGPLLFFSLGTLRLLVLSFPAALVGSHSTAIHGFNQVVAGAVIVGLASWWQTRLDRLGGQENSTGLSTKAREIPVRRISLALALGLAAGVVVGIPYSRVAQAFTQQIQSLVAHPDHGFLNPQGAVTVLPAYQLGLLVALWIAISTKPTWRWRSVVSSMLLLMASHLVLFVALGELWSHIEVAPHVRELRAWAIAAPVALAWWMSRTSRGQEPLAALGIRKQVANR